MSASRLAQAQAEVLLRTLVEGCRGIEGVELVCDDVVTIRGLPEGSAAWRAKGADMFRKLARALEPHGVIPFPGGRAS